ncbi:RND transporter [Desulfolithobacter dissulfuricans]|uniref:RND transporter n=1 Tax=Desulfolithobacter dissulfuricans TaxID=2795293 RepID=A0A915TXT7_9BACT|nr:TolC family protein [Desulfolithobacter dissulfuricans]BCO07973.1 RND transporter [Desulfolithobacter dissulfuricans]
MRQGRIILLVLFVAFAWQPRTSVAEVLSPPAIWSVGEAVRFALQNSPDSKIAALRIEAARAATIQARSTFLPRLDLNGEYSRTDNPMYSFGNILNQGVFNNSIDFNDPGVSDDLKLQATISYRLYNGGRDQALIAAAREQESAAVEQRHAVLSQLAFEVVRSFYTIVQAEETVQARQSAIEAIEASLAVAQARYDAGDLLKADLLNLEVQRSRARENLIQARHGLNLARRAFLNLLGLTEGTVVVDPTLDKMQEIPEDLDPVNRPELKRLDAMIRAAQASVRQARGGRYPTADAFGSWQAEEGLELDGSGTSWMAGVKLNYTLFDGRRTAGQIAEARAKLAEAREQRRKIALYINLEIEQARLALQQAGERLQVTEKMVEQALETARLSRERFKEGVILSSDLISVENRLTDALVRCSLARTERRIAIADLRRAVGLSQFAIPGTQE